MSVGLHSALKPNLSAPQTALILLWQTNRGTNSPTSAETVRKKLNFALLLQLVKRPAAVPCNLHIIVDRKRMCD